MRDGVRLRSGVPMAKKEAKSGGVSAARKRSVRCGRKLVKAAGSSASWATRLPGSMTMVLFGSMMTAGPGIASPGRRSLRS